MRYLAVLMLVFSFVLPHAAEAFTSGLFKVMKIGGESGSDDQTNDPIATTNLNLIVEADTYTPPFYKGRAEPTAGSQVRLTVIPTDASSINSYGWNIGGNPVNSSGQTIQVTIPNGVQELAVTVSALDKNGNAIGRTTEYLPISVPSLLFYEVNPLRGVSNVAIGQRLNLIGDEVLVRSEPYFLNNRSLAGLTATWNTGGFKNVGSSDWQTLTILRTENVPTSRVNLQANNLNTLSENLSGSFILEI